MAQLKGTKTHENLKEAFAGESQANRRYLYFARAGRHRGLPGRRRAVPRHRRGRDRPRPRPPRLPEAGRRPGDRQADRRDRQEPRRRRRRRDLRVHRDVPGHAKTARDEGFADVAEWFETLAKAEKSHAGRFQKALDELAKL